MFFVGFIGPLLSQILALLCSSVFSLQALPQEVHVLRTMKHLSLEAVCGWVKCNLVSE